MSKIEKSVWEFCTPLAEKEGLRVYDVVYKKEGADWFLRVFLYGENGVTLDNCERVSRALSDILDEADPIAEPYYLEVSSPGIERILRLPWHFETAIGETVEIKLYAPYEGQKKLVGVLRAYQEDTMTIETENGKEIVLEHGQAANVRTVFSGNFGKD